MTAYERLISANLQSAFQRGEALESWLPATPDKGGLRFRAFGEDCRLEPDRIELAGEEATGPLGLVISLYAAWCTDDSPRVEPLRAFREFPDSMPYQGAFAANSERLLMPHVPRIQEARERITSAMDAGIPCPPGISGDFTLFLRPLPKILLCYIFHRPDEEFPAAVTCLFSANAGSFLPLDGLADTAEYTARKILELISPG